MDDSSDQLVGKTFPISFSQFASGFHLPRLKTNLAQAIEPAGIHNVRHRLQGSQIVGFDQNRHVVRNLGYSRQDRFQLAQRDRLALQENLPFLVYANQNSLGKFVATRRLDFRQGQIERGHFLELHTHEKKEYQDRQYIH